MNSTGKRQEVIPSFDKTDKRSQPQKFRPTKTKDYQKLKLNDYTVGASLGRFLVYGFVLLILLFVCFNLVFFKYWADYHVTQTFEMMNLQGAQIKSQTIALMKQNDFAMT